MTTPEHRSDLDPLETVPDEKLGDLVRHAYQVFRLSPPTSLGVCLELGMPPSVERQMLSGAQQDITLEDLRLWCHPHFDPIGAQDAVRWILPRMLELLADGQWVYHLGNGVALQRLAETGFPESYKSSEQGVLHDFSLELAKALLRKPESYQDAFSDIDELLCMYAGGGLDLKPVLKMLCGLSTEELVSALHRHGEPIIIGSDPFWAIGFAQKEVISWWTSPTLEDRMIAFALNERKAPDLCEKTGSIADAIAQHRPVR